MTPLTTAGSGRVTGPFGEPVWSEADEATYVERVDDRSFDEWVASLPVPTCPVHGLAMSHEGGGEEWGGDGPDLQGYSVTFWCDATADAAGRPYDLDKHEECWERVEHEVTTHRMRPHPPH